MSKGLFGYSVYEGEVDELIAKSCSSSELSIVNTINPHSYVESKSDEDFKSALLASDYLIPDGIGVAFAYRFLFNKNIKKIAGYELFISTMEYLERNGGSVFFLGASEDALGLICKRSGLEFPSVKVGAHSPPFKLRFEESDIDEFIKKINAFSPDVVFVGLTAPKQEKLIALLAPRVNPKMISGIGAVFDFYAGTVSRPSKFWRRIHLEWLVRLIGEPKRLWRRNLISTPLFLKDVIIEKVKAYT